MLLWKEVLLYDLSLVTTTYKLSAMNSIHQYPSYIIRYGTCCCSNLHTKEKGLYPTWHVRLIICRRAIHSVKSTPWILLAIMGSRNDERRPTGPGITRCDLSGAAARGCSLYTFGDSDCCVFFCKKRRFRRSHSFHLQHLRKTANSEDRSRFQSSGLNYSSSIRRSAAIRQRYSSLNVNRDY